MSNNIVCNIGKNYILRLNERKMVAKFRAICETCSVAKQLHCLPCVRYYHHFRNNRYSFQVPKCSLSFSTSNSFSSSFSKIGFVGWYLRKLESRPIITKSITSSLIFAAADFTSQMITLPSSASFDLKRTLRMVAYGLMILGPSQHVWFNYLSKVLPKTDVPTTLKKIFVGQAMFGPVCNSIFFSYNGVAQGENGPEIVARLKHDLLPTFLSGLMYWPICDFVTFKFIPVHLQVVNDDKAIGEQFLCIFMDHLFNVNGLPDSSDCCLGHFYLNDAYKNVSFGINSSAYRSSAFFMVVNLILKIFAFISVIQFLSSIFSFLVCCCIRIFA